MIRPLANFDRGGTGPGRARRLVSGLPLKMPSHKVFHARHFYQRMIKASIRLPIHVQMLVLADEIGLGNCLNYLFAARIIRQFVVGGHVENLHASVDGGQDNLRRKKWDIH